jgi:hypothetical protein
VYAQQVVEVGVGGAEQGHGVSCRDGSVSAASLGTRWVRRGGETPQEHLRGTSVAILSDHDQGIFDEGNRVADLVMEAPARFSRMVRDTLDKAMQRTRWAFR